MPRLELAAGSLLCLCLTGCTPKPPSTDASSSSEVGGQEPERASLLGDPPLQIETNGSHYCVLLASGRVTCWGNNDRGQLGDGTLLPADGLVLVDGISDAEQLFRSALCVRTKLGDAHCWGDRECPDCVRVGDTALWRVRGVVDGSREVGGPGNACFLTSAGSVRCLGDDRQLAVPGGPFRAVHRAQSFACGEDGEGHLRCVWLDREPADAFHPPLPDSDRVAVGLFHVCVVTRDGRVHCWGDRLRSGYAAPEPSWPADEYGPAIEIEDLRAGSIAAGDGHTCVTLGAREVRCWGRTSYQTTDDPPRAQWQLEFADDVAQLAVGRSDACALLDSGVVECWRLDSQTTGNTRSSRVAGLPWAEHRAGPPPRTTGPELRAALSWANSPRQIAAIADLPHPLVLGAVERGAWRPIETICFAEHLDGSELAVRIDGSWSCNAALTRCVAQRPSDASVFRWTDSAASDRRLVAVVDYRGTAPTDEDPDIDSHITPDPTACALWRAVWRRDESLIGDSVTVLQNPAVDLGDEPVTTFRHHCGEDARRIARASLGVGPDAEDWKCDGLRCSYRLDHGTRGVLVFRRDPSGEPKLLVVGLDADGLADETARPLLSQAIARAERHQCS